MGKLVACPSCSTYVRVDESSCPHCDARLRSGGAVARTAGAMLMGLSLTACPAEDDGDDTGASSATMTDGSTSDPTTVGSSTDPGTSTGPLPEPAYGVGTTDLPGTTTSGGGSGSTDGGSSSGSDTDGGTSSSTGDLGSTSIGGPEYGVPETTSGE